MERKEFIFAGLMLGIMICLSGCGRGKDPVELLSFRAAFPAYDRGDIALYIDLRNQDKQRSVDGVCLEMVCNENGPVFQCWLMEPEGILPAMHNRRTMIMLEQGELPEMEIHSLTASLRQVNFTDGSTWTKEEKTFPLTAEINGEKGTGVFPVRLNETVFFEDSAEPGMLDPIRFQIDWTNLSEESSILSVVYQIKARTAAGSVILVGEEAELYISECYADQLEWIAPGMNNKVVTHSVFDYEFMKTWREKGAAIYEIAVTRVVDSTGTVWENPYPGEKIESILCGKKGYAFQEVCSNESVLELTDYIAERAKQYGINMGEPQVFVNERNYCILRYDNTDIRVELSDAGEVLQEKVACVYYSRPQYDDMENYVQSVLDQVNVLRLCLCPAVLRQEPYEGLLERLERYNEDSATYLACDDQKEGVFGQVISILDADGNEIHCTVVGMGKGLCDLPESLFWVRGENPWETRYQ